MRTLRKESDRKELLERIGRLRADAPARWGSLDAGRMVCHAIDSMRAGLGEIETQPMGPRAMRHFPLKQMVLHVAPFPKGAGSPREFLTTQPADFAADRERLRALVERAAATPRALGPRHPLLGPLTNDEWNVLAWKHLDHHLRQFGV